MNTNINTKRRFFKKEELHFINANIRSPQVRCIDPDGNHELLEVSAALNLAKSFGLDLVQLSKTEEVPTCKILDYSKFKYELSKKDKLAKKKQRENSVKIKEIKFRPSTDSNDLRTKAKHAQEFLDDGHRLKITIVFRGRELAYKEVATSTLDTFLSFLVGAVYENSPSISGKFMSAMIRKEEKSQ